MVVIRLARGGTRNRPFYHLVATDSHNRRDGRFIERLGFYNPLIKKEGTESLRINIDRLMHWKAHGAQLSETVKKLVRNYKKPSDNAVAETAA